jgi:hypothetical protein
MASLLGAFNAQLIKFIEDISTVLRPADAAEARQSVSALKLALRLSPAAAVGVWRGYAQLYAEDIAAGDIQSFIHRDYAGVLKDRDTSWLAACEKIRKCAEYLDVGDQKKTMGYVQLLTRLATMYDAERVRSKQA